jgi:hypothetical protein
MDLEVLMDVKEAVKTAKEYVADVFQEEGVSNLGLEEIEFDDGDASWNITVGFWRPWNLPHNSVLSATGIARPTRTYRVVKIRELDGAILSVGCGFAHACGIRRMPSDG